MVEIFVPQKLRIGKHYKVAFYLFIDFWFTNTLLLTLFFSVLFYIFCFPRFLSWVCRLNEGVLYAFLGTA